MNLRYSSDHEWIKTRRRQQPGPDRYHRLRPGRPRRRRLRRAARGRRGGRQVGQSISEVESTKSVSDIYAPVSGDRAWRSTDRPRRIRARAAQQRTRTVKGWICVIELADPTVHWTRCPARCQRPMSNSPRVSRWILALPELRLRQRHSGLSASAAPVAWQLKRGDLRRSEATDGPGPDVMGEPGPAGGHRGRDWPIIPAGAIADVRRPPRDRSAGSRIALDSRGGLHRPSPGERHLPRRRHRLAAPRHRPSGRLRLPGRGRREPERDLRQPESGRARRPSTTATRSRSASSSWSTWSVSRPQS